MKLETVLTEQNVKEYLESLGIAKAKDVRTVREVKKYTNVNYVFKVQLDSGREIFLKQAFDYVKVAPKMSAPIDRQYYEYKALQWFRKIWGEVIPEVIEYDRQNEVLILAEVGANYAVLAQEFVRGSLHYEILPKLAELCAVLHKRTYGTEETIRPKKKNSEHIDFIIRFRMRGAFEADKDCAYALISESLDVKSALTYGDFAAKNILVGSGKRIGIVDFENVCRFDPAYDLGYLLAHWFLEAKTKEDFETLEDEKDRFFKVYSEGFKNDEKDILRRSERYIGAIMLHRLVGGSKNPNLMKDKSRRKELLKVAKDKFIP